MNRTITLLMFADIFVVTGFGLIDPILAIFIKDNLVGGTIFAAGLASTLFFVTKCAVQLPFSRYVDGHDNKIRWLILGALITSSVPFLYIYATSVEVMYLAQILMGIGSGLTYPAWLSIWSTHLDERHEGFEWSLYSTMTGLGTAATASIGAGVAQIAGFKFTFALVGLLSLIGASFLFSLENSKPTRPLRVARHDMYVFEISDKRKR